MSIDFVNKRFLEFEENFFLLKKKEIYLNILNASKLIIKAIKNKNKLLFCGNGGSAADSEHLSAEFIGKFLLDRKSYPAIALTANTSCLTAISNDINFNEIFSRQINALGKKNDILFAISTSGQSINVKKAINTALKKKMKIIFLTSIKCKLKNVNKDILIINSPASRVDRIQEHHIFIGHLICELVEAEIR